MRNINSLPTIRHLRRHLGASSNILRSYSMIAAEMALDTDRATQIIDRLDAILASTDAPAAGQFRADAAATRFHLTRGSDRCVVVVLGGTGTGKSTLVNRLLEADVSATSFRRTFTAGPVAVLETADQLPADWLDLPKTETQPSARGQTDRLTTVLSSSALARQITLVDTPDLDGDTLAHHALADRSFRWADAIVFLVSPEKYQMTELPPYYRLHQRYELPALFVMNKCESTQQLEDYRKLIPSNSTIFAVPRDDAGWQPSPDADLPALKQAIVQLKPSTSPAGLTNRCRDLASRLMDHVLGPMQQSRKQIDRARAALLAMETPAANVDVNPITEQLQRRMRERSVLYLVGPQRMLDRVRQAPAILARLPRTAWDLVMRGKVPSTDTGNGDSKLPPPPDFRSIAVDQFMVLRSRIDDILRSSGVDDPTLQSPAYALQLVEPGEAGKIVDEELATLTQWLDERWNATPRDTAMLEKLLKVLPGGKQLTKLSEAAPYLLTIVVATHHAFFGHLDLMIIGGWSLVTWLTEKINNEVAAKARETNDRIAYRFEALAIRQINQLEQWLDARAPKPETLKELEKLAGRLHEIKL